MKNLGEQGPTAEDLEHGRVVDENHRLHQLVDLAATKLAKHWRCDPREVRASLEAEHALSHPVPR